MADLLEDRGFFGAGQALLVWPFKFFTYRLFKNEDPDAETVRPIIQVQTICRCKKGR